MKYPNIFGDPTLEPDTFSNGNVPNEDDPSTNVANDGIELVLYDIKLLFPGVGSAIIWMLSPHVRVVSGAVLSFRPSPLHSHWIVGSLITYLLLATI